MTKKRRILVVSEGPEDKWFAKKIFENFILDCAVEVVTFKTDVYQLYEMYTINTALLLLETYYGSSIEIIESMFRERKKSP